MTGASSAWTGQRPGRPGVQGEPLRTCRRRCRSIRRRPDGDAERLRFRLPLRRHWARTSRSASRPSARAAATGAATWSQVQVNGGMHPGNSGGPVTDARGDVVGVSVAVIRGTQINFAIPGDFVRQVLDGRFDERTRHPYRASDQARLP